MLDFSRIIRECFWDIDINESEIKAIVLGDDIRKTQFLFEKILLNSTKMFNDLSLFDEKKLKTLLSRMEVPHFNSEYVFRRKNLAEVYFFNSELLIDELKWVA